MTLQLGLVDRSRNRLRLASTSLDQTLTVIKMGQWQNSIEANKVIVGLLSGVN